jgi:hypothetical protein
MADEYRGQVRPRRQPPSHHIQVSAGLHKTGGPSDPFGPLSNKQFPSLYIRNPIKNVYRSYMRQKSPYRRQR